MYKPIRAAVVFLCCVLCGLREYRTAAAKRRFLDETLTDVRTVKTMLRARCAPLDECFAATGGILRQAAQAVACGKPPTVAVKELFETTNFLDEKEKNCFFSFANGLCAADCDGQIANAELFEQRLADFCAAAASDGAKKGALALRASVLTGCAAAILLL